VGSDRGADALESISESERCRRAFAAKCRPLTGGVKHVIEGPTVANVTPPTREDDALRRDLAGLVTGGRASTGDADRVAYAKDLWPRQVIAVRAGVAAPCPPAVVVWPSSTEEVAAVVRYAGERRIPLVPFGAGSGVCAGVQPDPRAIVLDVKRMRRVERMDADALVLRAQAGILGQHLEDALEARGLTLGHFPSSIYCSTLGGWIAARSAGQCSGRYGKIEDMVLGLECVDGAGQVRWAERGGPDEALLPLVIGSEGTLAVVTRADLRIAPAPAARRFASFTFPSTQAGLDAIRQMFQAGLRPAVARLYDPFDSLMARRPKRGRHAERSHEGAEIEPRRPRRSGGIARRLLKGMLRAPLALNKLIDALPDELLGGALLVLVWEADPGIADAEHDEAMRIARDAGGRDGGEAPARRWLEHRHSVSYRQSPTYASGAFADTMEVASTWSRLWPMYEAVRAALSRHVFVMAHFSHAYPDGASIYFTFAGSASDDARSFEVYDRTWRDALAAVVEAGGTISHHHGVGRSKVGAMAREHGVSLDAMRALSRAMDPHGIMNPGALVPRAEVATRRAGDGA
jgi:alkyldihydroxyacetonephosphate synthase